MSQSFIIYNDNGDIIRLGNAPEPQIQGGAGEHVLEVALYDDPIFYKVINGSLVRKDDQAITSLSYDKEILDLRAIRNSKLSLTDSAITPDRPLLPSLVSFRQSLRDFPATITDPTTAVLPEQPSDLAAQKADAKAVINHTIGKIRASYITVAPGQDGIYLGKETEARAWLSQAGQDIANFPLLSAEIGITAPDPDQLAQVWLNLATQWRSVAADLEGLRVGANNAVDAAADEDGVATVMAAFTTEIGGL